MTRKSIAGSRNPLNSYLDSNEDDDGLTFIARQFAEQFDVVSFRIGLVAKLKRVKYQPGGLKRNEKTFHQVLTNVGVLDALLQEKTLYELGQCTLLKKIVQRARELNENDKAVDGQPLWDLRRKERQLFKDLLSIEEIVERNSSREEAEKLYEGLERKYRRLIRLLLISTKYKGSRADLLSGGIKETLSNKPRDEDVATKVAIYRVLRHELQTKTTKKGLSDSLLRQLAELVWAPSDVVDLSDGTALYRALRRSP